MGENRNPNCLKCNHFKVTWDPEYPRACEVFGIKGQNLPSIAVYNATGRRCPAFSLKMGLKE